MPKPINNGVIREYQGLRPSLASGVYIDPAAVVIGNVHFGEHCSVWPGAVIRGDMHSIHLGKRVNVQDNAVLHITHAGEHTGNGWPLKIGDDVTIGHSVNLHGCTIGNRVLIGIGSIILDGATIADDVMIGAGTLVPPQKTLASGHLYMGSPCKAMRPLTEEEINYLAYSANNYVALKETFIDA